MVFPAINPQRLLPSPQEMAAYDANTIAAGTPAATLMNRAGAAIYQRLRAHYPGAQYPADCCLVLCGPGNNGGDGFVIARHLLAEGLRPQVVLVAANRYSEDLLREVHSFIDAGGSFSIFGDAGAAAVAATAVSREKLIVLLQASKLLVDSLLGTGQSERPRGSISEILSIIEDLNPSAVRVSVDVPTGINCDSGEAAEYSFRADLTVCVQWVKRGLLQAPANTYCGRIEQVEIKIHSAGPCEYSLLDGQCVPSLSIRSKFVHKGSFGKVLVIGGCENMPGAPVLSATAALRVGTPLVTLAKPCKLQLHNIPSEIVLFNLGLDVSYFDANAAQMLGSQLEHFAVVVLGPGLGMNAETKSFVLRMIELCSGRDLHLVLDADGLNLISPLQRLRRELSVDAQKFLEKCVCTPHPGEMGRLLEMSSSEVQRNRYQAVRRLSEAGIGVVVLKGASSIVYSEHHGFVNTSGNPYLATAGSGDVLSGIIAGLMAQGMPAFEAVALGVYVHGRAGDRAHAEHHGPIIASDISLHLPRALAAHIR